MHLIVSAYIIHARNMLPRDLRLCFVSRAYGWFLGSKSTGLSLISHRMHSQNALFLSLLMHLHLKFGSCLIGCQFFCCYFYILHV